MAIKITELVSQMKKDIPIRISHIDLATAYGWYLGMFQAYTRFKKLSQEEYDKIFEELLKLYLKRYDELKQEINKKPKAV